MTSSTTTTWPSPTRSPSDTVTSETVPAMGAAKMCTRGSVIAPGLAQGAVARGQSRGGTWGFSFRENFSSNNGTRAGNPSMNSAP